MEITKIKHWYLTEYRGFVFTIWRREVLEEKGTERIEKGGYPTGIAYLTIAIDNALITLKEIKQLRTAG